MGRRRRRPGTRLQPVEGLGEITASVSVSVKGWGAEARPSGFSTVRSYVPGPSADGTEAVRRSPERTSASLQATSSSRTTAPGEKPEPSITTGVAVPAGAESGTTRVTLGCTSAGPSASTSIASGRAAQAPPGSRTVTS